MAFNRTFDVLGDLKLTTDGRDIVMIDGAQKVVQSIRTRAQIFKGSWRYDLNLGVPYFQDILIGGPKTELVRRRFYELIAGTPGVISVQRVDILFSAKTQTVFVSFACTAADGTALTAKLDFLPSNAYAPTPGPFYPTQVLALASGAWLSVAGATTVAGALTVPNMLNSMNPAVQTVAARCPAIVTSTNGLPCLQFATNTVLNWPLIAANNNTSQTGIGFWFKSTGGTFPTLFSIDNAGAASVFKFACYHNAGTIRTDTNVGGGLIRSADTPAASFPNNTWAFFTLEDNMLGATEADRVVATVNGVPMALTFSGATGPISALTNPTGSILIGNTVDNGTGNKVYNGLIGPNLYVFNGRNAGATSGLLTPTERLGLMNYQAPT